MGTSSARPENLETFARRSRAADRQLDASLKQLIALYHAFSDENRWGEFHAWSLMGAFERYMAGNGFTARWVAQIAATFRAAGGDGRIVRLSDAAIKASLKAHGLDRHRNSVTFDDPTAFGKPPTTGYTDDPINTASGNFVEVENDLVIEGLLEALSFSRTYNSCSDRVGPFGRGWASWASTRLVPRPEGIEYIGPDGQEALFPRLGDGYGRVIGISALVEPMDSGLALCWFGGRRWEFDEAGRLVIARHGPGTEVRLSYDSAGRLDRLAHAAGKTVRFVWDDALDRILSLECSDGRRVSYGYDAGAYLIEVDRAGVKRRYEIDDIGRVVSVIDADGVVELVNTYDDDGRVLEQLSPFGRRTYLSYLPGRVTVTMDDDEHGPVNTYVHDAFGRLITIEAGDEQQMSMQYDDWSNLISLTERNGAVTVQEYDDRARPVRRTLPTGATYTFVNDEADRIVEVALSNGAVTRYRYEGDERIAAEIVDPEGGITRQTVHGGLVHRIVDPDGVTVDFEFDADGNVLAATDGEGHIARLERDPAGRIIAVVSPLDRRTAFFYDTAGHLVERHDPGGGEWRYEYSSAGRLVSVTDPLGAREEFSYGPHGSPTAAIDPLGHVTTSEYDVLGNVVGVVEPGGAAWRYTYDALMRLTATVDPTGARWEREYDVAGTLVGTIDPTGTCVNAIVDEFGRVVGINDGQTSERFERDEFGTVIAVRRADGSQVRGEHDLCGRRTLTEDASGAITRLDYTPGGRVLREISPSGRAQTFEHDACGRVVARTDGAGRRWEYGYDADGTLVEMRFPTGERERFAYDQGGQLARWSAPGGGLTTYAYDPAGRVVAVADREAGASRFEYDPAGRIIALTDANGATIRCAYDERGWLAEVVDPLGGTATRRYDAVGRLIEQTDQLGRVATASYDATGRLVERADDSGRRVRRSYDASGRLTSFGADGEEPITIEYDQLSRVVAVDEPGSFSHRLRWDSEDRLVERARGEAAMRWAYDADGERTAIGYPDETETTFVRDDGGYVVAVEHPALGRIELQRDAAGRLTGASAEGMRALWRYEDGDLVQYEMQAGGTLRTAQLSRDPIGRVVQATIDGAAHEYAYDAAGQLVSAVTPDGRRSFKYGGGGRLTRETTPSGAVEYEYDAAGQLTSRATPQDGVVRYAYDAAGYRVSESGPELERRYRWDAHGRLAEVRRTGPAGDGVKSTRVVVDALGELAALDGTPMLWDTAHPLQPLTWNGQDAVVGEGSPWALTGDGALRWLAPDWQGTIGDVPRDPWGAPATPATARDGVLLGYRGELEFEGEIWLRSRTYEPVSRSFQQPDPLAPVLGSASAANPYHYAANNPLGLSDPLGLRAVSEHELQEVRDRMDRGWADDLGDYVDKHASDISAITGIAAVALAFTPLAPLSPILAAASAATGTWSAYESFKKGEIMSGVLDTAGVVLAPVGALKAYKAVRAGNAMRAADEGASEALGLAGRAENANLPGLASGRYAEAGGLARKAREASVRRRALRDEKQMLDYGSAALSGVGAARAHAKDAGLYRDPFMPSPVPPFAFR